VILVEVKSSRPTDPVRLGTLEGWTELVAKLGKAYKQLENSHKLIAGGESALSHMPANLPRIGSICHTGAISIRKC
jgi:hypothetical protein